ncbi:MAG: OmpH family outer membrane protein [Bernardetiaceae bacterium]|nr:OmpH family outer membrane protein [Bernardetiaceae bacterium]
MKNTSLVFNIALTIAVVILFFLHFSKSTPAAPKDSKKNSKEERKQDDNSSTPQRIAYINSDTISVYYDYYDDVKKDMEQKQSKIERQVRQREESLQNKYNSFVSQMQAGLLSTNQAQAKEEELRKDQMELEQYKQSVMQGISSQTYEINEKIYTKISEHIRKYNEEFNFDLIIGYSEGANVFYANPEYDITKEILAGLNEEYRAEKEAEKNKENKDAK